MSGMLVDPFGREPMAINEHEYEYLKAHLEIMRHQNAWAMMYAGVIEGAILGFRSEEKAYAEEREPFTSKDALAHVLCNLISDDLVDPIGVGGEAAAGAVVSQLEGTDFITASELKAFQETLVALRAGGWFATWLTTQVHFIAGATTPPERYPSPMMVAGSLANSIEQYQNETDITHEMIEQRPDLFIPQPKPAESAPVQARVPGSTRKETKKAADAA